MSRRVKTGLLWLSRVAGFGIFGSGIIASVIAVSVVRAEEPAPLRFGVLSIAPPSRIHLNWQPFTEYLATQLGRPVEIVVPRGFGKMKQAAGKGKVDVFYVNSHVYYRLRQAGAAVPLAQMQNTDGKVTSRSDIFVRADSPIRDVHGLEGHSIAYVSPMGAGGYLAPRAYLYGQGVASGTETREVFTKNLSTSLHQVLLGEVDAASMCGVNFRLMSDKLDAGELRIIASSDPYQENVLAARVDLDPALREQVVRIVLGMPDDPRGRAVLAGMKDMKIDRFVAYDPQLEQLTTRLLKTGRF